MSNNFSNKYDEDKISLLIKLVFLNLVPNSKSINLSSSHADNYITVIEETVFNHYKENVKLSQLAKKMHLCEKQVQRIIKKYFNKTLSDLIMDKKMQVASELILNSRLSITEIIREINFNSESYFYNMFQKYFGCTPNEFRLVHQNRPKPNKS